ncbi:MAG: flagellar motor switch protein FliG [Micrococcales bacterium]|nr:MAG: flagellar motor switch protein FliG [Micrococcales bacterium]PIE27206.1 MAG: flagellar motor switch protein FliG [Micrococcales bacterium]
MAAGQRELTGTQKAAVLLLQMGKDRASKVLAVMHEAEVEEIAGEILKLKSLPASVTDNVIAEFHSLIGAGSGGTRGGMEPARQILEGPFGRMKTDDMLERLANSPGRIPFAFLRDADPRQLLNLLSAEHPQTIALVLAHLRPEQASAIMSGLERGLQADVACRIASMDRTSPEMIRAVAEILHRRTSSVLDQAETSEVGGLKPLVEIINRADPGTEKLILEGLEARDADLAEKVRSKMFVFDDILGLEDRAVQMVLRQVESGVLAKALKGVKPEVAEKVLGNVSERARENLTEEIELLGRLRVSEVEEARAQVVATIRALESAGEIVLRRGEEEDDFIA